MDMRLEQQQYNPYRVFSRAQWAKLRDDMPMTLQANEIAALRSLVTDFRERHAADAEFQAPESLPPLDTGRAPEGGEVGAVQSGWRLALREFTRNRLAVVGVGLLLFFG